MEVRAIILNIFAPNSISPSIPTHLSQHPYFHYHHLLDVQNSNSKTKRLPPGPWKLPLIGSMFHLLGGLPHQVLRDLAKKYGPIMHLQLGEVSLVVVTSPDIAKQVLKTHDIAFASRPKLLVGEILFYKGTDIVFSPYGDYWRQMRKICLLELLSAKNVKSFSSIRQDEVLHMIEFFDHLLVRQLMQQKGFINSRAL
ncbi:hypothetical protein R3W88_033952 [Solanum pinnatisectum]|uniref:Cytochrome P450 n=1 Tax=Solanum pinnatisectum TaxID=50273 RepID=A0AAV9K1B8_9SOLN|nr:hypothetical protein R3W88_033952 [Solanum pinnatisectum]